MTTLLARFAVAAAGAIAFAAAVQASPRHDHAAHAASTGAQAPMPAQRWATDAPLRDGMGRIRVALDELRHHEMGHMSDAMALDRVALIEAAAADIFARCKLAAQADAALHGMLVPLLAAAHKLKADPQDVAQVAAMRQAVAAYPRYFDDPGWPAEAAPAPAPHHAH
ncbi:DnrO protein [Frateuria sp. Soil773]|uniref:hypothetical protein n=1 Tax=Frateuria sp. Soil773 TaxID=1736407 RepID=UPI0006F4D61D|nr:hypothetical protein [Frateuria sp. Soil773]KRE89074.1 DnrO protein [Frateuria sp. Soil773]